MSSVDNRIVRMEFDNAQFEAGVSKSMKTLDELNEKLQFKEAAKGVSALQVCLDGVNFDAITSGVQRMANSFTSVTGMIAQHIRTDIVDAVFDAAKKLENMTLGQIKSGGWARASNIANAKFTIEGLKYSWDEVRAAADYAVTDTAYGLDVAAKAASQLAASGVDFHEVIGKDGVGNDLTQMHKSLRAISGVAAMTNSSYEEISHIFTRVAGQGKVMANDLNSIAARGINAAAELAKQLNVTEAEVREMVGKGLIDFNTFAMAMDDAYGDHAKEANKTFTGALSNMKAALSRIGAIFAQPVIDKTNTLFISITSRIKEFQKALNDTKGIRLTAEGLKRISKEANNLADKLKLTGQARTQFIDKTVEENKKLVLANQESLKNGDVEEYSIARFATHFAEAWESAITFASKFVDMLDLSWFQSVGSFLDNAAIKMKSFFDAAAKAVDKVKAEIQGSTEAISDALNLDIKDLELLHRILDNEFGFVEERWAKLDKIYEESGSTKTGKWLQGYMDQLAGVGYKFEELGWTEEEFRKKEAELAKTEAQRISEMSAEEALISGIAGKIKEFQKASEHFKNATSSAFGTIMTIGESLVKVLYSIETGFSSTFNLEAVGGYIEDLTVGIKEFALALVPTDTMMQKFIDIAQLAGIKLHVLIDPLSEGAKEAFLFAAACLKAEESLEEIAENNDLTPLQKSVVSVLRVIKNLWKTVKNVGKAIGKIMGAIYRAFMSVFNPSGILSNVADFSESLANMSEKLILSDAAAYAVEIAFKNLFTIVQGVANVVTKVISSISKFLPGAKSAKKETEAVTDTVEEAGETVEKTNGLFEKLSKVFETLFEKIKGIPQKFEELKTELDKQEGVQRLKKNLEDLWKTIKDAMNKGVDPLTEGIDELASVTGTSGETSIGKFANAIGYVAGKIADFMDKLPEWGKKVEDFWNDVKTTTTTTIEKLNLGGMFKNIGTAFENMTSTEGGIFEKIKVFAEGIFESVSTFLKDVDWSKVGKTSLLTLVGANLFNFFKITAGIEKGIKGIADIPAKIGKLFGSLTGVFTTAQQSLKKITNAYIFVALAQSMVALVGALILIADLPEEKIKKGLATMSWIAIIMLMIGKTVNLLTTTTAMINSNNKQISNVKDQSTKGIVNISNTISSLVGFAAILISLGGAIFLITKGLTSIAKEIQNMDAEQIGDFLVVIKYVLTGMVIMTAILAVFGTLYPKINKSSKSLYGFGIALAGMGVAVFLISRALVDLSSSEIKLSALGAMVVIVLALAGAAFLIGKAVKGVKIGSFVGAAILLGVMTLAIGLIAGEILLLSLAMVAFEKTGNGDAVMAATGVMVSVLLALGVGVALMGSALQKVQKPGALIGIIASMVALLLFIGIAIGLIAKSMKDNSGSLNLLIVSTMILTLGVIALGVSSMIKQLNGQKSFLGSDGAMRIAMVALLVAAMGVALLLIGEAAKSFSAAGLPGIIASIVALSIIAIFLGVLMGQLKKASGADMDGISNVLFSVAIAMLAMAASLWIFAKAAQEMQTVDPNILKGLGGALMVVVIAIAALALLWPTIGDNVKGVSDTFLMFSISLLIVSAAVFVLGLGVGALGAGLGVLADGIAHLAEVADEHKLAFAVAIAVILTIIVLAVVAAIKFADIARTVASIAEKIVTAVSSMVTGLSTLLSNGSKKLSTWWKGKSTQFKAGVVSVIVGICSAIVSATPEMLKSVKTIIQKVIYFIIDIIPTIVNGLVDILIRLINALADVIRKNSAAIAYAVWNVVEALLEIIIDVLVEGSLFVLKAAQGLFSKIGLGDWVDSVIAATSLMASGAKAHLRQGLDTARTYANTTEDVTSSLSSLDAEMNKIVDKTAKETGYLKDANGEYVKTGENAENAASGLGSMADMVSSLKKSEGLNVSDLVSGSINGDGITSMVSELGIGSGLAAGNGFAAGMGSALGTGGDGNMLENMMNGAGFDDASIGEVALDDSQVYTSDFASGIDNQDSRQEVASATDNLMGAVEDTIENHKDEVEKAVDKGVNIRVHNTINAHLSEREDEGKRIGNAIINGFLQVMNDRKSEVEFATTTLGATAYDAFTSKDGIDSNSPSKKFYQGGLNCITGFTSAIDQNESLATGAMTDLSTQMINSFGNPLEYAAKIASGEIEYDPTIRPVMDMSNVGRSAMNVGSMFRDQSVSLSGLSGQIAYDMTNLNGSNAAVVAEIQALREDMNMMTDEIANMQIVMDTGALVGSTVGAYDAALGKRQFYSGRGN